MNFAKTVWLIASIILTTSISEAASLGNVLVMGTTMDTVICPAKGTSDIVLYNQHAQVVARAKAYVRATLFQGWGTNRKQINAGNATIDLVRVQIAMRSVVSDDYFVPEYLLASQSVCAQRRGDKRSSYNAVLSVPPMIAKPQAPAPTDDDEGEHDEGVEPEEYIPPANPGIIATLNNIGTNITRGLNSPVCCLFPLAQKPTSYLSSPGKFGSGRRGGRVHGGSDLYGRNGEKVRAIAAGQVVRAPYFFKGQTMAMDILHDGGFVARYGEISRQGFGLNLGSTVTRGQQVGAIAKLPCCAPMLHLELYSGGASGKLTQSGNKYNRRRDILDPTGYLKKWSLQ